jgi:hypothetical protein
MLAWLVSELVELGHDVTRSLLQFLATKLGHRDLPGLPDPVWECPRASFVSISDQQRQLLPDANSIRTVRAVGTHCVVPQKC